MVHRSFGVLSGLSDMVQHSELGESNEMGIISLGAHRWGCRFRSMAMARQGESRGRDGATGIRCSTGLPGAVGAE